MKTYKVTLMVPKILQLSATSIQDAHNQVYKMLHQGTLVHNQPRPIMHTIELADDKEAGVA